MNKNKQYKLLIEKADNYFYQADYKNAYDTFKEVFTYKIIIKDYINYGLCAFYLEKYDEARKIYEDVLKVCPEEPPVHIAYAILLATLNEFDSAIYHLNKHLELIRDRKDLSDYNDLMSLTYSTLSGIYFDTKEYVASKSNALESLKYKENTKAYYILIEIFGNEEKYDETLKYSLALYNLDKEAYCAPYLVGVAYKDNNDMDKAYNYFLEESERNDAYPYAHTYLALYYIFHGDYDQAIVESLKALEHYKDDDSIWYNLGCAYALKSDYKNAYDCLKASIYLNDKNIEIMERDPELAEFIKTSYFIELTKLKQK